MSPIGWGLKKGSTQAGFAASEEIGWQMTEERYTPRRELVHPKDARNL